MFLARSHQYVAQPPVLQGRPRLHPHAGNRARRLQKNRPGTSTPVLSQRSSPGHALSTNTSDEPHGIYLVRGAAHVCMQRSNEMAYATLIRDNAGLEARLHFLGDGDASFLFIPRRPLVLIILDYQARITYFWSDALVQYFYQRLRQSLTGARTPSGQSELSPPRQVVEKDMPFI